MLPEDIIIKTCLRIKNKERVLIVTDNIKKRLALKFLNAVKKITPYNNIIVIEKLNYHGQEPAKDVAEEMKNNDVIIIITEKSLTHTRAVREARKNARIVSMPGINAGMLKRAINIDYDKLKKLNRKLKRILDNGREVKIVKDGYVLKLSIKGRKAVRDDGIYSRKGDLGNLPAGEVFIAPLEGTANGEIVFDVVLNKKKKTYVKIKDGMLVKTNNLELYKLLKKYNSMQVGELGIGTNPKASIKGNILEDEKVAGTIHIAFGKNIFFGGNIDVPLHVDCIARKVDLFIDDKKILNNKGRLI